MNINFSRVFQGLADRYGDHDALVNIERNNRYTFRELHQLSNRIARMMGEKLGLGADDYYLSILENDNLSLVHLWTSFKGEAISAWTNYRDSIDEHLWQVELIGPKVVFVENELLASHHQMLRERGVTIVCMDPLAEPMDGVHYFWELLDGVSDANLDVEKDSFNDVALLRFTGGTTDKGKCAEYTIDNWLNTNDIYNLTDASICTDTTRFLHIAPLSHGTALKVMPTFLSGGCTVTMNMPDLALWCRNVEAEKINVGMMVPTIMYRLLEMPEVEQYDLSSLETIVYGAAPMSPSKLKLLQQRFGNIFIQAYGSTENISLICYLDKADHLIGEDDDAYRLSSCGKPVVGVEVLIMDDDGNPVPKGESGEIWVRGRSTIRGYYKNPEATAKELFNGFWKSGDIGLMDDAGYVHIVDRKKDMIITGGFNVYATEVEAALSAHPAVMMSAVVGVPHPDWGEAVHAEVMLSEGHSCTAEELILHTKELLGGYKVPKSVTIVEQLPQSAVGKVLRREVREKYWKDSDRRVG